MHHCARALTGWAVGVCLAPVPAGAAEWGVSIGSGIIYSDNLERTEDATSATLATTDLAGQIIGVGDNYDVDVEGAVVWREYFDSSYESDVLPQFRGEANWAPMPEQFVWTVRDNFGQVALSPNDILQPVDRQDINVFSTGPAVTFPLAQRMNLQIAGLFSDVYYENDETDYNRLSGSMTLEREISVNQVAYIWGFANRTEFKDPQFGSYDFTGYFLGYEGLGARTGLIAEVGIEELHDEGESEEGLYVNLDVNRTLGERTSATLSYLSRYADSADIFALDQNLEPVLGGTTNLLVSADPVWLDYASLELRWEHERTSAGVFGSWSNEDADSAVVPDREISGVGVYAGRWLTDSARLGATASYFTEIWTGPVEQEQDDIALSLELEVQLGAKVSLLAFFETFSRDNSPVNYDENRVMVLIRYTPKAVRAELPSFYERRLNRRFVVGGESGHRRDDANESRERP
jgi:hypothetical protein